MKKADMIETQRHEADAIQADAELKKMESKVAADDAKQRIDEEMGFSAKMTEFRRRLNELRNSTKSDVQQLMHQYRSDWEGFRSDIIKSAEKAGRLGRAEQDLLEAKVGGLMARIQYLIGLQTEDNAKEAKAIQKSLEPILQDFKSLGADIRRGFERIKTGMEKSPEEHGQSLKTSARRAKEKLTSKNKPGVDSEKAHH